MAVHDPRYLSQTQPRAVLALGCEEWFKNAGLELRRDAWARIADLSQDAIAHLQRR